MTDNTHESILLVPAQEYFGTNADHMTREIDYFTKGDHKVHVMVVNAETKDDLLSAVEKEEDLIKTELQNETRDPQIMRQKLEDMRQMHEMMLLPDQIENPSDELLEIVGENMAGRQPLQREKVVMINFVPRYALAS